MKKSLLAIMVGALLFAGIGVAKADANISISYPVQSGEYASVDTVTVNVTNELGVNARVRWGTETGVYTASEIHAVIQGENIIDLDTPINVAGVKYMKVELQDSEAAKLGDTGEISFTITAPLSGGLFEVPEGGVSAILAPVGDLMNDGWQFIAVAIGLPVAFYVVRSLINIVGGKIKRMQ
jgi:hypothetical protein